MLAYFYTLGHKPHVAFAKEKKNLSHFPNENSPNVEDLEPVLSFDYWINSTLF